MMASMAEAFTPSCRGTNCRIASHQKALYSAVPRFDMNNDAVEVGNDNNAVGTNSEQPAAPGGAILVSVIMFYSRLL